MNDPVPPAAESVLAEKLLESLESPLPGSTPRVVHGAIHVPGKVTALVGARRAGKTTFLHEVRRRKLEAGEPRERLPYVNFEDERLVGFPATDLHLLPELLERSRPGVLEAGTITWCLDEIQTIPGWERFVRRLLDRGRTEIYVTGSSAALLSREIATALRGRAWEVVLPPFGLEEFLRHRGAPVPRDARAIPSRVRAGLERGLVEYLEIGGFPEVQGFDPATRRQTLRDYVDVAMLRDVVDRHGVTNVVGLRWLVRHLLGNPAAAFSVQKFYAALRSQGIAISKDLVHELLAHLTDCFLVRTVWMEARSERQRMVNPRKGYPVDPGLIPVFDRSGRANIGHALETAVLVELERRRCEVTYVRTSAGYEVDFLARFPAGEEELIQVCADASDPATAEREMRALADAADAHPRATRRLLTLTRGTEPRERIPDVVVQPAYEWILGRPE